MPYFAAPCLQMKFQGLSSLLKDVSESGFFRWGVISGKDHCLKVLNLFKTAARAAPFKNDPVSDTRRVTSNNAKIIDHCCAQIKSATVSRPGGGVSLTEAVEKQLGAAVGEDSAVEEELITMFAMAYSEAMRLLIGPDNPDDIKETETPSIPPGWNGSPPWQTEAMTEEEVSGLPCLL